MKYYVILATYILTIFLCAEAQAQRYRGFTVGDTLDESDISDMADLGANVARYWCRAATDVSSESEEEFYARVSRCLDLIDSLSDNYEEHGIKVFFVLDPQAPLDEYRGKTRLQRIFQSPELQAQFKTAWTTIATHFKDSNVVFGFDLMNEPAAKRVSGGAKKWKDFAVDLSQAVRDTGATQRIYVKSQYGNPTLMSEINGVCKILSKRGISNVHSAFHFYSPREYTHQGIYGYPTPVQPPDAKTLKKKYLKLIKAGAKAKNCGSPFIGEIGATKFAPNRGDYFFNMLSTFEQYNMDYAIHSWRESSLWSVEPEDSDGDTSAYDVLQSMFSLN